MDAKSLLTDVEFNKLLASQQTATEQIVEKSNERLMPMVIICFRIDKTNEFVNVAALLADIDFSDHNEKVDAFTMLGSKAASEKELKELGLPLCIFLITEAWVKRFSSLESIDQSKAVHDYDDKQEKQLVMGRTFDGRENFAQYDIVPLNGDNSTIDIKFEKKIESPKLDSSDNLLASFYKGYNDTVTGNAPSEVNSKFNVIEKHFDKS